MKYRLRTNSVCNEAALERNKTGLVSHDMVAPTACHLGDSVDTSTEDGDECGRDADGEESEFCVGEGGGGFEGELVAATTGCGPAAVDVYAGYGAKG